MNSSEVVLTFQKGRIMAKAKGRPKAVALPGLEDRAIQPLEDAAHEYVGVRDERMDLTQQEVALNEKLLKLMKTHGKRVYRYQGLEIRVVASEEKVKVKTAKKESDA